MPVDAGEGKAAKGAGEDLRAVSEVIPPERNALSPKSNESCGYRSIRAAALSLPSTSTVSHLPIKRLLVNKGKAGRPSKCVLRASSSTL